MALVSRCGQPLNRRPDLGWIVLPELVGHELVHRQVEARVHRLPAVVDLLVAILEGVGQLRVLGPDEKSAIVLVVGVEEGEVDLSEPSHRVGKEPLTPIGSHPAERKAGPVR